MSDHDGEYAEERHRHYDLERDEETAQRDIRRLREDVRELRGLLDGALDRIGQLEGSTPEARQAQYEADVAAADLAESGYDRHGSNCDCPYCTTDEPEADGEDTREGTTFADYLDERDPDEPGHGPAARQRFMREHPLTPVREPDGEPDDASCPETRDNMHCGHWPEGGRCCACGLTGPDPDDGPDPEDYDPGSEADDEGGMSEYRHAWLEEGR